MSRYGQAVSRWPKLLAPLTQISNHFCTANSAWNTSSLFRRPRLDYMSIPINKAGKFHYNPRAAKKNTSLDHPPTGTFHSNACLSALYLHIYDAVQAKGSRKVTMYPPAAGTSSLKSYKIVAQWVPAARAAPTRRRASPGQCAPSTHSLGPIRCDPHAPNKREHPPDRIDKTIARPLVMVTLTFAGRLSGVRGRSFQVLYEFTSETSCLPWRGPS